MAKHEIKFTVSTTKVFALAFCLGVVIGAPLGIASLAIAGKGSSDMAGALEVFTEDETVCVNGVTYAPHRGEIGSPWNGIYQPVQQAQPTLIGEDGERILQQVIPTPCKITRG